MTSHPRVTSASPYEELFGFCRAIRTGDRILVAGTAPIGEDGRTFAPGDAAGQARRCFDIIGHALAELGSSHADVVRTRMYLTSMQDWEAVGRVHGEVFGEARPVATMVGVASLIDPDWRVEIEAEAMLGG
ncbi:RidA family protein [bacterium]|nr:RidA family protein [bacterium]